MNTLPPDIAAQIARALAEDVGGGDVTAALIPATTNATATYTIIIYKNSTFCLETCN